MGYPRYVKTVISIKRVFDQKTESADLQDKGELQKYRLVEKVVFRGSLSYFDAWDLKKGLVGVRS